MVTIISMLLGFIGMIISGVTHQYDLLAMLFIMEIGIYSISMKVYKRDC